MNFKYLYEKYKELKKPEISELVKSHIAAKLEEIESGEQAGKFI